MASLRETQRAFALALRSDAAVAVDTLALRPAINLDVYRNNADWQFRNALSTSFPVLRRRVGDDYFRQLAFHYRARFPSRSGDLHWVGRHFAEFLAAHLAGGEYVWLADLARLEWAREQASVAEWLAGLGSESLATIAAEDLDTLVFDLQPSMGLGSSDFPVVSVWLTNQVENAPSVDQSLGGEHYLVHSRDDTVVVTRLAAPLYHFLSSLKAGAGLGGAMSAAELDEAGLLSALQFVFREELVIGLHQPGRADART